MLNKRLLTVAKHVPTDAKILDVGCDHAYLSIYLSQHKAPQLVIASDIVSGPVDAARKNIRMVGLQDKIRLVQADGVLGVCPGEVDCIVIAGMGAGTIIEILSAGQQVIAQCHTMIFQPMAGAEKLRQWLAQNAWLCTCEDLCMDNNRLYEIIVAQPTQKPYTISRIQALVGNFKEHELLTQHLKNLIVKYTQLLSGLKKAADHMQVQDKVSECETLLEQLYEVKDESTRDKRIVKQAGTLQNGL